MNQNNQTTSQTPIVPQTQTDAQAVNPTAPVTSVQPHVASVQPQIASVPTQTVQLSGVDEDKVLRINKKVRKAPFILLFIFSLVLLGVGIHFFLQSKAKYDNYVVIGADLKRTEKVFEAGVPYYMGTYKYVVDGKKYTYKYSKKFEGNPDRVIQIRYNPKNPSELYDSHETIFFIIVSAAGGLLFLVTFGVLISKTSKKEEKIVLAVVFDSATCVGGRKIYMKTINPDGTAMKPEETEYYSYFTDKYDRFPVGKRVKFNLYKYNKSILTEKFNDIITVQINSFSLDDFIFY